MCDLRHHLAAGGAQMDTLSPELAHTCLDGSGLSQGPQSQGEVAINRLIFALRYAQHLSTRSWNSSEIHIELLD